ncbi:MAG: phosphoribosylanthranilate isomerase [Candidatus Azotimanducaceae bacterium]|jgi:phosphoribosylanthranilate isomerase
MTTGSVFLMRTRIKICGITDPDDLQLALSLGADAIGFNMFESSPRYVEVDAARSMVDALPPFVSSVGLFVNEAADAVAGICSELPFDILQFHGDEENKFCRQFGKPFIKVLRISSIDDFAKVDDFPDADGFLFDAHVEGLYGGTGQQIGWELLEGLPDNSILAGGLNAENVAAAITRFKPFAVDVSSGVEASPGKKDVNKMTGFFNAVATADRSTR